MPTPAGGVLDAVAAADPVLARYRDWLRAEVELAGVTRRDRRRGHRRRRARRRASTSWSLATGPSWSRPEVAGASRVRTPPELGDVLADDAAPPATVAIVGGGKPGLTLALALRARGADVTLVEPTAVFGTELGLPGTLADGGRRRGGRRHAARRRRGRPR